MQDRGGCYMENGRSWKPYKSHMKEIHRLDCRIPSHYLIVENDTSCAVIGVF